MLEFAARSQKFYQFDELVSADATFADGFNE
jgi:hypothetical protein